MNVYSCPINGMVRSCPKLTNNNFNVNATKMYFTSTTTTAYHLYRLKYLHRSTFCMVFLNNMNTA